jgi:hypothetical protein
MKAAYPKLLSGNPLTAFGGAPPRGEHSGRSLALVVAPVLLLAACAPKAQPPQPIALDCSQPFEAQKAKITAQPNLTAAPADAGEPYSTYSTADGKASWFITEPGAPAHPAILMQQVATGGSMKNTGCAYGDKAAYDQLVTYIASLKAGHK